MGDALTARMPVRTLRSKRLLALAGDDRLVEQIRRGNELAFEVAFERHGTGILGFCRHMLGSREEAEDAVQHAFAAAFHDLQRGKDRQIALKPWLYTIARNRCVSLLRARREQPAELEEIPTDGLHEQVERRSELRELLGDLRELPEEQRAALLLAEAADLSHAEVAGVLGCEVARVKALVFRARSGLIERRDARETSCADIREQLANLRGGSLRRSELRHHLRHCPGCSAYREQVRRQRQMLAAALPVMPSMALKSSVLSAAGIGGGAAGGGAVAAAGGGAAVAGGGAALGSTLGSAAVAKLAVVAVLAGGGVVAGEAAVERVNGSDPPPAAAAPDRTDRDAPAGTTANAPSTHASERGTRMSAERSHGRRGADRSAARSNGHSNAGTRSKPASEKAPAAGGRKLGQVKQAQKAAEPRGGGQANALARGQARAQSQKAPSSKAPSDRGKPPAPASQAPAASEPAPMTAPKATPPGQLKLSK
ncbi:MAG TPA: sigma-70 family RNA polymerase sigma factor [Thermoleophilaceae bacterium]|nr:sigma-70 family RNA polymerase sigma factor [Thermoleophilaceae bacterium]